MLFGLYQGIDWISVTIPYDNVKNGNLNIEGMTNESKAMSGGGMGYTIRRKYIDGRIMFMNPDRPDMGIHIVYSGQTLRTLYDVYNVKAIDIVRHYNNIGAKFTRLDVYVDAHNLGLSMERMESEARNLSKQVNVVKRINGRGHTLYVGKRGDDLIRIYDKGAESGSNEDHIRLEVELRSLADNAVGHILNTTDTVDYGAIARHVAIINCIDFYVMTGSSTIALSASDGKNGLIGSRAKWLLSDVVSAMVKEMFVTPDILGIFVETVRDEYNTALDEYKSTISEASD